MTDDRSTITFLGEAMVELTSTSATTLDWTFAGDVLNAAAACAAAGPTADVRLLTGLGEDDLSDQLVERCRALDVDASASERVAGRTLGLYWVTQVDGERRFRYWRERSAARAALESGRMLGNATDTSHLAWSGITLAVAGDRADHLLDRMARARAAGVTICFDVNLRPSLWPDEATARRSIDAALALADLVIASSDDVRALWPDARKTLAERVLAGGASEVVVSDGAGPVTSSTATRTLVVQPEPATVVDTAGAGDALWGTYLGRRLDGADADSALRAAVAAGRCCVEHAGALGHLAR